MRIATPTPRDTSLARRRPRLRGWLLVTVGCLLFAQTTRPVESQRIGLVAAYSFDEGAGTVFADASGNGNQGTVSGATWAAGRFGGALSFDGVDDLATVANSASLSLSSEMTLEAWVLLDNETNPSTILAKERQGGIVYALYACKESNRPTGEIVTSRDEENVRGISRLSVGTWTHLAVTFDGSLLRMYVNGSLTEETRARGSLDATGEPLRLGGQINGGHFSGRLDDVRIYNRALASTEIRSDMNGPIAPPPAEVPDTTAPAAAITSPAAGAIVAGTVAISADASDDVAVAGVQFLLDGAPLGTEDTSSPYSVSWNTAGSTNTVHRLSARARDGAGNTGLAADVTVTVSNPPVLTLTAPAQGASISGATVDVAYAIAGDLTGVDHVSFRLDDGAEVIDRTIDGKHALADVAEGTHVLAAYLGRADLSKIAGTDAAPVSFSTVLPDTAAPVVSITAPTAASLVANTIAVTASATDNRAVVGVQFLLDGAPLGAEDTSSPYFASWNTAGSTNTGHRLSARARDAAGNTGIAAEVTVTVSNPPALRITAPVQGASITGGTVNVAYAIAGDPTGVDHVRLRLDNSADVVDATIDGTHALVDVAEGTHVLNAYLARADQSKIAGTDAPAISFTTVLPDTTGPAVSIASPAAGSEVSDTVTVAATASDDSGVGGVQFLLDGAPLGAEDTSAPYSVSWDTASATNAAHILSARARDEAGNTALAADVTVTVSNPAVLIITAPAAGSLTSGSVVNVAYTTSGDLTGVDHVHFTLDSLADVMDTSFDGVYALTGVAAGAHVLKGYLVRGDHSKIAGTDAAPVSFATVLPDTTPPVVSLTAPAQGSTLTGAVAVTADATDDVGVARVQFLIDGASLGAPDAAAPYAVSWPSSSVPNGSHILSAIAYDAAGNQSAPSTVAVSVANTDPAAERGQWSPVMNWPLVAVHASLLHTGEVLVWDAWEPQAAAKVWNPATNTFISVPVQSGLFCAAHSHLADGRVLVVGGHTPNGGGIPDVHVFDPATRTWSRTPDMSFPRWYPSSTTLGDGRVFALSGTILGTTWADTPEIYDPSANAWSTVPQINTSDMQDTEYPLSFLLPDGRIAAVTASLGKVRLIDPVTRAYVDPGSEPRLLLSSVAMYRPGRLLATGGGDPRTGSGAQTKASVIDFNQPSAAWRPIAPMAFPRYDHNLVVLADGSVLAVGGATELSQTSATGTLPAELFDPVTETWQTMASMRDRRIYHSTALLLPDGRVLAAGGGRLSPATDFFTAEIFSPPYLFKGPRPVITSAPATIALNGTMVVGTPQAAEIATVALIRLGSVTHTLDMDQRYMELPFTAGADRLVVAGPGSPSLAPPGYYMLVIKNSRGVPSVAAMVRVPAPSEDTEPPSAPSNLRAAGALGIASLAWDPAVDNQSVAAYSIHRSSQAGFIPSTATIVGRTSALSFIDSGVVGTYFYKVTAEDAAGNTGPPSNEAAAGITADTTPPLVIVTAPAIGEALGGTTILTAVASDDVGVAGVQFLVDGVPIAGEDTAAPYSVAWNTGSVANGTHTVSARARDLAGNQVTSPGISVSVSNTVSPDLVAAYGFNEGSGATVFDVSSSNNIGTITAAAWTTAGRFGGALSFNGVSSWVTVPDAASLDLTTALTVEAWVNPAALSGWRSALIKESGGGLAYALYANDNTPNPALTVNIAGDHSAVGTSPLPLNTWTHLAATYDGGQLRLYVNGVLAGTRAQSGSITVSSSPLRIGGNAVWGEYFSGLIDEVRIYRRALSAAEIQADMNAPIR